MRHTEKNAVAALLCKVLCTCACLLPGSYAEAFCGMYVSSSDEKLLNEATQVVVLREGTLTGLTMQNNYKGPVEDFAMVVPVPEVLSHDDVTVVPESDFDKLIDYTVPRLVEYDRVLKCRTRTVLLSSSEIIVNPLSTVKVEAEFSVSEYDLVVLSAKKSADLLKWLEKEKYKIPPGGDKILQGYINAGMYFFVARVDPDKLEFDEQGRAVLTPLHFSYHSEDFSLPIRLGLLNADGPQDLIIHVISNEGRVEAVNYTTGIIPTNLIVKDEVLKHFAAFYETLFTTSLRTQKASILTEFSAPWPTPRGRKCDPCTSDTIFLPLSLFLSLGSRELREFTTVSQVKVKVDTPGVSEKDREEIVRRVSSRIMSCYNVPWQSARDDLEDQAGSAKWERVEGYKGSWKTSERKIEKKQGSHELDGCLRRGAIHLGDEALEGIDTFVTSISFENVEMLDSSKIRPESYTVTRLHGRFDPESVTEDIVFSHVSPLEGGYGAPDGERDRIDTFYSVEKQGRNRFQARYMVLHPGKASKKEKCYRDEHIKAWQYDEKKGAKRAARFYLDDTSDKPHFTPKNIEKYVLNAEEAGL